MLPASLRKLWDRQSEKESNYPKLQPLVAGEWHSEIVGSADFNFGQVVQPGRVYLCHTARIVDHAECSLQMTWRLHDHGPDSDEDGTSRRGALFEANQMASLSLSLDVTRPNFLTCCHASR
jgi:hypothetical protein